MRKLIALFVFVGLLATFNMGCNDSSKPSTKSTTGATGPTGTTHATEKKP
jgi:hypothetical protein